jgi:hypothetical protein
VSNCALILKLIVIAVLARWCGWVNVITSGTLSDGAANGYHRICCLFLWFF